MTDLQHVSSSCLLLKRFAQLAEQAGVLDSDDGLRGEVLNQFDLLVSKADAPPDISGR